MSGNPYTLRNSVNLGSLPIFKSGRTAPSSNLDPAGVTLCLDDQQGNDARKPVKAARSGNIAPLHHHVNELGVQQEPIPPAVPPKTKVPEKSGFAGDFEQEMITALGLSPKDAHSRRSASTPLALGGFSQANGDKRQAAVSSRQLPKHTSKSTPKPPAMKSPVTEKSLPVVPHEPFEVSFPDSDTQSDQPSQSIPHIVTPSIRPVLAESPRPPAPPPKDHSNSLAPAEGHKRQFSVSTLGAEEQTGHGSDDEADREPPSPLELTGEVAADTECRRKAESSVDDNPAPSGNVSSGSVPSAQQKRKSFIPFYPTESSSSASLESKRKSSSGLPFSAPNTHSPLRNEVRNPPGTRSSMLSFGSFGKLSGNRGSRPVTPATGLSQASEPGSPAQNEESTIGKLKSFGRRRRASVGDLLSNIQVQGSQGAPAGQRKRTFSRLSVCRLRTCSPLLLLTQIGAIRPTGFSRVREKTNRPHKDYLRTAAENDVSNTPSDKWECKPYLCRTS